MATKLDKPLIRDTGLARDGKPVLVTLIPTPAGGNIVFKEKGGRGKGIEIPLLKILTAAIGIVRTPVKAPEPVPMGTVDEADLVPLATLEARLMIDGGEILTPPVKGALWAIVREIREERREDLALPPVIHGPKRTQRETRRDND